MRSENYNRNGVGKNIAILCTKMDNVEEKLDSHSKKLDKIVETLPAIKIRSKINSALIFILLISLIGVAFKALGG